MNTDKTQSEKLPQDAVMQSVLKASDLRIGNKILFLGDVVTFKNITEFREDGIFWIKTFEPKIESKNFHFKPIKLTEEWLNKLGFFIVETNGKFEATLPNFRYNIYWTKHTDGFLFCDGETALINFNYLHELQNLVFALGQRELTVA